MIQYYAPLTNVARNLRIPHNLHECCSEQDATRAKTFFLALLISFKFFSISDSKMPVRIRNVSTCERSSSTFIKTLLRTHLRFLNRLHIILFSSSLFNYGHNDVHATVFEIPFSYFILFYFILLSILIIVLLFRFHRDNGSLSAELEHAKSFLKVLAFHLYQFEKTVPIFAIVCSHL